MKRKKTSVSILKQVAVYGSNCMLTPVTWANGLSGTLLVKPDDDFQVWFVPLSGSQCEVSELVIYNEGELVADGIIGFWLAHYGQRTREIFRSYYNRCLMQYRDDHKTDVDEWARDLEHEFKSGCHHAEESGLMEASEALYEYLPQEDADTVRKLTKNYLDYVADLAEPSPTDSVSRSDTEAKTVVRDKDHSLTTRDLATMKREVRLLLEELREVSECGVAGISAADFNALLSAAFYLLENGHPKTLEQKISFHCRFTKLRYTIYRCWLLNKRVRRDCWVDFILETFAPLNCERSTISKHFSDKP